MIKITNENGYNADRWRNVRKDYQKVNPNFGMGNYQTFTGKSDIAAEGIEEVVRGFLPTKVKILNKLGAKRGEIQNIIINAMGTGLVAPIFIKYNFLSDADEDTRTYSAWRQPLSAVLAVVTQAGMTVPFYKIYDKWANIGEFDEAMNKTLFQDEDWIKKQVKNEDAFKNATKDTIKKEVKIRKNAQYNALLEAFSDESHHCRPVYQYADGTSKPMSNTTYKNLLIETIDRLEKFDKKALENIEETLKRRTIRSKYYKNNYTDARAMLTELKDAIDNSNNIEELNKYLTSKINKLQTNAKHSEMFTIYKNLRQRAKVASNGSSIFTYNDIKNALSEKTENMLKHADKYKDVQTDAEVETMVKATVEKERNALTRIIEEYSNIKKDISETTSVKSIKKQLAELKSELNIDYTSLDKDFTKEVVNRLIARTKSHHNWYKQFTGIFVSLAMLPFTCTLLNWIYPRFMDIFFPNLSNKKHNNSSAKLVAMAPKAEVHKNSKIKTGVKAEFKSESNNTPSQHLKKDEVA